MKLHIFLCCVVLFLASASLAQQSMTLTGTVGASAISIYRVVSYTSGAATLVPHSGTTSGGVGISASAGSTGATITVIPIGIAVCEFDGAFTVGNVATVNGDKCHDAGTQSLTASTLVGTGVIGIALASASSLCTSCGTINVIGPQQVSPIVSSATTQLPPVTFASLPGAGAPGQTQIFTDTRYTARHTGSTWEYWYQGWSVVPPSTLSWTWLNQGSATIDVSKGFAQLAVPAEAGENIRMRYRTAPSAPYSIRSLSTFDPYTGVNYNRGGAICLNESSTGRFIIYGSGYASNTQLAAYFSAYNSPTSTIFASTAYLSASSLVWYRVDVSASPNTITYYSSATGDSWIWQGTSTGGGYPFTGLPDRIGFCASSGQATYSVTQNIYSWVVQ